MDIMTKSELLSYLSYCYFNFSVLNLILTVIMHNKQIKGQDFLIICSCQYQETKPKAFLRPQAKVYKDKPEETLNL
jgi:hypothetical protein